MGNFFWNLSHVYELDDTSQWTGRCFFTYFLDAEKYSFHLRFIEFTIYFLIFGTSFTANISVIVSIIRNPEMKTVANCFVLNVAAADLVFVSTIPPIAYTRFFTSWKLGDIGCKVIPCIQIISAIVLLWTLAFMAIDRYRCVAACPYSLNTSIREIFISLLILWIITAIASIPLLLWFQELNVAQSKQVCTLIIPEEYRIEVSEIWVTHIFFFASVLPLLLFLYNYGCIFNHIISTRNIWGRSSLSAMGPEEGTPTRRESEISISEIFIPRLRRTSFTRRRTFSQQEELRISKRVYVIRSLFVNTTVVLVLWFPLIAVAFAIYLDANRSKDTDVFVRSYHFVTALILACINTILNPVLYSNFSETVRLWCCLELPEQSVEPIPMSQIITRPVACGRSTEV